MKSSHSPDQFPYAPYMIRDPAPKKQSYFTALRDAMDIDRLKAPALYFGTTTGQLWIGRGAVS